MESRDVELVFWVVFGILHTIVLIVGRRLSVRVRGPIVVIVASILGIVSALATKPAASTLGIVAIVAVIAGLWSIAADLRRFADNPTATRRGGRRA